MGKVEAKECEARAHLRGLKKRWWVLGFRILGFRGSVFGGLWDLEFRAFLSSILGFRPNCAGCCNAAHHDSAGNSWTTLHCYNVAVYHAALTTPCLKALIPRPHA